MRSASTVGCSTFGGVLAAAAAATVVEVMSAPFMPS
jgi:hypothetical protein